MDIGSYLKCYKRELEFTENAINWRVNKYPGIEIHLKYKHARI